MKWSRLEPYFEKNSIEDVVKRAIREQGPKHAVSIEPVNLELRDTRRGKALRILYKATLPEDASEYPINRIVHGHAYIYEEDDQTTFKLIKKAMSEAKKDA